jgi:hypothetical protein
MLTLHSASLAAAAIVLLDVACARPHRGFQPTDTGCVNVCAPVAPACGSDLECADQIAQNHWACITGVCDTSSGHCCFTLDTSTPSAKCGCSNCQQTTPNPLQSCLSQATCSVLSTSPPATQWMCSDCTPGQTQCSSGQQQTCTTQGYWDTAVPCQSGDVCFSGACCTPSCAGLCGGANDGCGGTCTSCPAGQVCAGQICRPCNPKCAGKCDGADDGCGGTCDADCPGGICVNQKCHPCPTGYKSCGGDQCVKNNQNCPSPPPPGQP